MISDAMTEALNKQINMEMASGYIYMGMSTWADSVGLKGAANWFWVQAQEEMTHAMRLRNYVSSQGRHVRLAAIPEPAAGYDSLLQAMQATLAHEQKVTASINALVQTAREAKDYATEVMLQWFVSEQVEEEASVHEQIDRLTLAGDSGGGLFMIDRGLGRRVFHMPPALVAAG